MTDLLTVQNLIAFISLAALEIVLGIDNIVFIAIITSRLPQEMQSRMRRLGLAMAMGQRVLLLLAISWIAKLTDPVLTVLGRGVSGRDLILLAGGLFLIAKATYEIHGTIEGGHDSHGDGDSSKKVSPASILMQITVLDAVFSLDSVITAVGMVGNVAIMIGAIVVSVIVMMLFANPVSNFIIKHPTVKMLALSFLLMIGFVLVMDGTGVHVPKAYVYFAMGFSILVEILNFKFRQKAKLT